MCDYIFKCVVLWTLAGIFLCCLLGDWEPERRKTVHVLNVFIFPFPQLAAVTDSRILTEVSS